MAGNPPLLATCIRGFFVVVTMAAIGWMIRSVHQSPAGLPLLTEDLSWLTFATG